MVGTQPLGNVSPELELTPLRTWSGSGSCNKPPDDNSDVAAANAWKNLGNNLALALGKLAATAKAAGTLVDGALAFGFAFAFGALAASCTYGHGSRLHVPEG